jgi:hypothetical protein
MWHNGPLDIAAYVVIALGAVLATVAILARIVHAIRNASERDPPEATVILRPGKRERPPPARAPDAKKRRARAYFAQRPPNRKR